jgi:hypothetical protein
VFISEKFFYSNNALCVELVIVGLAPGLFVEAGTDDFENIFSEKFGQNIVVLSCSNYC